MKVFYIASARAENLEVCRSIHHKIVDLGHDLTTDFMISFDPETFYDADENEWHKRYKARLREIAQANICVFESSMHSLAIGQLVQESLRKDKPVIVLHDETFTPNFILATKDKEKRIQVLEYTDQNINEVLEYGLENAEQLVTTRFTMLMPPEYNQFLDEINQSEGISRSDYIRNLITDDMKRRGK